MTPKPVKSGRDDIAAGWSALYALLKQAGVGRPEINWEKRNKKGDLVSSATLAWPDKQVAVALETDKTDFLVKDGWSVIPLNSTTLAGMVQPLAFIETVRFAYILNQSRASANAKTSMLEQRMLGALIDAGIPIPDRNLTFVDSLTGQQIAIPDFAWEHYQGHHVKVGLDVDGWWWHGGQDLKEDILKQASTDPAREKQLLAQQKNKTSKDASKRRALQSAGWTVFIVGEQELNDDPTTAPRVAQQIRTALHKGTQKRTDE